MSYKYSSGSIRKGDIYYEDDREGQPTYIDFGQDTITLRPSGSQTLHVTADSVGIGTTTTPDMLTINGVDDNAQPYIRFREAGDDRAKIGINSSNNLIFEQKFTNKHIVFKVNDAGTTREGLRINGTIPEVTVNEGSESLVDFRVEGSTDTHLIYTDGANDRVGISTSAPTSGMHIRTSIGTSFQVATQNVTLDDEDYLTLADASSGNVTVTIPDPQDIGGRIIVIKRKDDSANTVTITPAGGGIEGGSVGASITLAGLCSITLQSDNASNWWKVAEYINPP